MNDAEGLDELRERIDDIDGRILELLSSRCEVSLEVGRIKSAKGIPVFQPQRESELLVRLAEGAEGPLSQKHIRAIYSQIISVSRDLQRETSVAFLGPEGSYTAQAARTMFGDSTAFVPERDLASVFREVESERCDYGVVPVENTTEGVVTGTLDLMSKSTTTICSETAIPIRHNLMSNSSIDKVRVVYSHPQVFAQCREWLAQNMADVEQVPVSSTTEAARKVSTERNGAAIGPEAAAVIYGMDILERDIQDNASNTTRFLVIGSHGPKPSGRDRTSITFSLSDRVGALYRALEAFKDEGIMMTMIQSRPSPDRRWEYVFFVDLKGHMDDPNVSRAIDALSLVCMTTKVLGSYPRMGP